MKKGTKGEKIREVLFPSIDECGRSESSVLPPSQAQCFVEGVVVCSYKSWYGMSFHIIVSNIAGRIQG